MSRKINFKRKRGGGGSNWGAGLDYLLQKYWNDLDKLIEDNYYGRHDTELINFLFSKILESLDKSIIEMRNIFGGKHDQSGLNDWIKKAKSIKLFAAKTKKLSDKVISIDNITQFLRETSINDNYNQFADASKAESIKNFSNIKGITAFKDSKKVRGIAKIIINKEDFSKIKEKNILIVVETNAAFLIPMKKSKAIITDRGGILCHAAIISRELKIPCIVGTKIATQVFKDGDLVEVDAEKGIARKL